MNISVKTLVIDLLSFPIAGKLMVPKSLGTDIKTEDPNEYFCHVEFLGDNKCELWLVEDWRTSEVKRKKDLDRSQQRVIDWEKRKNNIETLAAGFASLLGMTKEECRNTAEIQWSKISGNKELIAKIQTKFDIEFEL